MSKRTPGSWAYEFYGGRHYVIGRDGNAVARVTRKEDVNIIAAAPDLLEALEAMVEYVDRMHAIGHIQRPAQSSEACKAIARAKGKSQ